MLLVKTTSMGDRRGHKSLPSCTAFQCTYTYLLSQTHNNMRIHTSPQYNAILTVTEIMFWKYNHTLKFCTFKKWDTDCMRPCGYVTVDTEGQRR